jgi:tetrahydromethanopterin S-methyltransferase subunit F
VNTEGRGLADDSEHGKLSRRIKRAVEATKARTQEFGDNAEWVFGRRTARVLGVVVLFAVVVALLLVFLNWYVAPTKPTEKKDLVLALAQILAGTALLSGLYFTWRTLQVNREGQITERFTRAIDQLGATGISGEKRMRQLEIRLGGIYALEQIAAEASDKYHWPIMEILTAYVREVAPRKPETMGEEDVHPHIDIQAILTVIGRRTRYFEHGEPEPLDPRDTDLRCSSALREGHLEGAHLMGANLKGANLRGAILAKAKLMGAILRGADLWKGDLSEARLTVADLSEANLKGANLERTDLLPAQLEGTDGDENTRLPSPLKPPARWGVKRLV